MKIKVSDYIVEFLIKNNITDVFGYPGGMVTHIMDSFSKYQHEIKAHLNYNEQGAAFAACGYAQVANKPGVAYATSGPGATNLITGIANAYFDSIPTIFITGQVNTYEKKTGNLKQKGFQETDFVRIVEPIVKGAFYVDKAENIPYILEDAYALCMEGRRGPVVLDIPMDIQKSYIKINFSKDIKIKKIKKTNITDSHDLFELTKHSKRPVLILGNGLHIIDRNKYKSVINKLNIPYVTSMIAIDLFEKDHPLNYGFIGAYGSRVSNFILAKADLVISLGSRLDIRQVGSKVENFASNAKLIRFDIDKSEFERKIKKDEFQYNIDIDGALTLLTQIKFNEIALIEWKSVCKRINEYLNNMDNLDVNKMIYEFSKAIPDNMIISADVGQNQVWIAQSFDVKPNQKILLSGGHGAMGYSLPAAIGAYYASNMPVISFNGDGGIQMNIQELQFLARESIPIKVIVLNNNSLGMIRHFQEMYFESRYYQTVENNGFLNPDYSKIAEAYGIRYIKYSEKHFDFRVLVDDKPCFIEMELASETYVYPKLVYGKPNQDQEPTLERNLYNIIMEL